MGPGPWIDMTAGSGCVASTAHDMALYCRWLIAAGRGKGAPILSDAGAARFTKATIEAPGWAAKGSPQYANGLAVVEVGGRKLLHHTGGMLAYNSALHVDPQAGVGAFASTNVGLAPYRPRDITAFACERLARVVGGRPEAAPAPAPPKPAACRRLSRALRGASKAGDALTVVGPRAGDLGPDRRRGLCDGALRGGRLHLLDPAPRPIRWCFAAPDKRCGPGGAASSSCASRRPAAFSPPTPPALKALTGHYVCDDPWAGSFRVTAQGEALFLDDVTPLTALPDGVYRAGEKDWSPERLQFDASLDGRPMRAIASGVDHLRRPIP